MSTRGQVCIRDKFGGNVYLYSHYDSYRLMSEVQKALNYRKQWDNAEYLARMIFEVMLERASEKEYGFGIGTKEHSDIDILVTVDCDQKIVIMKKGPFRVEAEFEEYLKADITDVIRFSGSPPSPPA
jgi:hypothetical protein